MFKNLPSPMMTMQQLAIALAQTRRINKNHWKSYGKKITRRGTGVLRE